MNRSTPWLPGCLQEIQGAAAISRDIVSRGNIGIRNRNEGGQVKNDLLALDQPGGAVRVGEVPQHHFDLIFHRGGQLFQQAPIIPGIIAGQGPHPGSQLHQALHQMAADESPGTGYQDAFPLPIHSIMLYAHPPANTRAPYAS